MFVLAVAAGALAGAGEKAGTDGGRGELQVVIRVVMDGQATVNGGERERHRRDCFLERERGRPANRERAEKKNCLLLT